MEKLVRILAMILLLGTTAIFVLKIFIEIPVSHKHLFILFLIGAISFFWANLRGNKADENKDK